VRGSDESSFSDDPEKNPDIDRLLPTTLVAAGGNLRLPFCERVQLRARGNIIIDGSCLHSTIYVGGNLVIKGRLQGGTVVANGLVYVEDRMGGEYGDPTRIMMGYDPFYFLKLQKIESRIAYFRERKNFFESMSARNQVMEQEYAYRLSLVDRKLNVALRNHKLLWERFALDEKFSTKCRIVANNAIMPGCEIYIGRAFYKTLNMDFDLTFFLEDDEIRTHRNTKR
ncbi:MAG: FapA family protein, partial [Desulfovibrio sp.]|nr:FapA family protein [Desulfovibrio sp.]